MNDNAVEEFNEYRIKMNDTILSEDNRVLKRFFNLDTNAFLDGAIPGRTKEMLGLVSSMVLRCDDCIKYHLGKCYDEHMTKKEIYEIFQIASVIGGTIVIPHLRRAVEYWELLEKQEEQP